MQEKLEQDFIQAALLCKDYTQVSVERMYSTWQAVRYVTSANIPGALVECGVWRGGNLLLMATALLQLNIVDREIWGYDTFEGMSPPTEFDKDIYNRPAAELLQGLDKIPDVANVWNVAPEEGVRKVIGTVPYPSHQFRLVRGRVEETVPKIIPRRIAVLRLDTDWYESTLHELIYLFPLLEKKGGIIIDDYGHWEGARKAVDEYFSGDGPRILLNRIDYTGRMGVKI